MSRTVLSLLCIAVFNVSVFGDIVTDNHRSDITMSGTVNGLSFSAIGHADYFPDPKDGSITRLTNSLTYTSDSPLRAWPQIKWPKIKISLINTWKCNTTGSAKNLAQLTGGNFGVERTTTYFDSHGTVVGEITAIGTLTSLSEDNSEVNIELTGWYNGPDNIDGLSGYRQLQWQEAPGRLGGEYFQTIFLDSGEHLQLHASTIWTYDTPNVLAGNQYSVLELDSVSFDDSSGSLFLSGYGYYEPVPEPSSLLLLTSAAFLICQRRVRRLQ